MPYEEPERMRDIIAEMIYQKKFDELTDFEKERVHALATKLRKVI